MRGTWGGLRRQVMAFVRESDVGSSTFLRETSAWQLTQPCGSSQHRLPTSFSQILALPLSHSFFLSFQPLTKVASPSFALHGSLPLGARYSTLLCSSRSNDLTCSGYLSGSTTLFRETFLTETLTGLSRSDKPGFEALRILGRQSRRSFYSFIKSARLLYSGGLLQNQEWRASWKGSDAETWLAY
ncbi:hypothetical protein BDV36DRAFT_47055 [Aspergillus pseudocaelatus]|uniref:Uncharacterized protein n=1 Tax=Aspergillus pseudocaelatus TaxID=1825620 RepID=A0ABQ6W6Z0_9EURO|nr:hypothetical protein BDV36DRAFT_47055 [Aspergillus pseudocaelatus]